jgi:hypothetical protein
MKLANSTGLSWADLADAGTLDTAIRALQESIQASILVEEAAFSFVVFEPWELQVQLVRETRDKDIQLPEYLRYPRIYSLADEYRKYLMARSDVVVPGYMTLPGLCDTLSIIKTNPVDQPQDSLLRVQGTPHRAGDKCAMLQKIADKLLHERDSENGIFSIPSDMAADLKVFLSEGSKVLHLSGLAYDTTQSELESWFTQHGGRPIAFWTLRTLDQHKLTGTGFAIFSTHDEARTSLGMNSRLLGDRTIQVSPSSSRILDRAADILTPFPVRMNTCRQEHYLFG